MSIKKSVGTFTALGDKDLIRSARAPAISPRVINDRP